MEHKTEQEEIRQLESRWKSDVDRRLDRLMGTADKFDAFYDKHSELLRMLLDRETSRKRWRDAIMEKTFAGLIWFAIVFLAAASWEWINRHIGRP